MVQGGSSITQQLVKLTLLSQAKTKAEQAAATADTYARKLKELRYAIALEQTHSKDWILERYLNTAYFGDGAYGVQAAAKHYFNVNARDLNLRQSAMLAGLVKNPYGYDPTNFPDRAIERRDVVLDRMAQLNVIPRDKAEKNKQKDLGLNVQDVDSGCVNSHGAVLLRLRARLPAAGPAARRDRPGARNLLKNGGLTIKTTLNMTDQDAADNAVAAHVCPTDQAIGALAIEEPGTGNVLALAQSRPMGNRKKQGETYINFTIPEEYGGANGFQPGSTFKAFTLATALEQGLPLTTQFNSPSPMTFNQADFSNCPGEGRLRRRHLRGARTPPAPAAFNMYSGTRQSINTYYLQLEELTGVCAPYELAQQMGVRLTDPRDKHGRPSDPDLHPRRRRCLARWRWPRPTPRSPPAACTAPRARSPRSSTPTATSSRTTPSKCTAGDASRTSPTRSATCSAASSRAASPRPRRCRCRRPARPAPPTTGKAVWFCGYTPHIAAAATIARHQRVRHARLARRPDRRRQLHLRGDRLRVRRPIWGDALQIAHRRRSPTTTSSTPRASRASA